MTPPTTETLRRWAPLLRGLLAADGRLPVLAFEDAAQSTAIDDAGTLTLDFVIDDPDDATLCDRLRKSLAAYRVRPNTIAVPNFGIFTVDKPPRKESEIPNPKSEMETGRVAGKLALVTGAAQGFGLEIAAGLVADGARVALADLNADGARAAAERLNAEHGPDRALALALDVTKADSVQYAVDALLRSWGGLDILISNAGVLRAGAVADFSERDFDFVTDVNYKGYFLCVRAVAAILARQHRAAPAALADIIQINSKSGLEGSNRNFAYAGGKFGGIGLTQSFALELVDAGVKVNAVCPGNFLDGPLWTDPENGLFVQYLKTNKVPGAKTVDDVRRFYEAKVPMNRGCRAADVMNAIFYLIDQQYETGQALPVTGGQVMLS
jgi:sorbitol-6-phosphate 2-dehydrogenase